MDMIEYLYNLKKIPGLYVPNKNVCDSVIDKLISDKKTILKILNDVQISKYFIGMCKRADNAHFNKIIKTILSSNSYYLSKGAVQMLLDADGKLTYSIFNRNKHYIVDYFDDSIDFDILIASGMNYEILKYYVKSQRNDISFYFVDWYWSPISVFKTLVKTKITIRMNDIIDHNDNRAFWPRTINQIIVLSKKFRFNIYDLNNNITFQTNGGIIVTGLKRLNYLRLLIRKRSRTRIKLMEGNLIERLLYKLLSTFTSKNISKLILYFA